MSREDEQLQIVFAVLVVTSTWISQHGPSLVSICTAVNVNIKSSMAASLDIGSLTVTNLASVINTLCWL